METPLAHIRSNYENRKNPLENLSFHNVAHTKTVMRRVDKTLEVLGANRRTMGRAKLYAGFHDSVQNWKTKNNEKGFAMRDRSPFPNEEDSFKMAREYMEGINKQEDEEIFTSEDIEHGEKAIMATKASGPGSWDTKRDTIVQSNLQEDSPLEARALALADIGGAGMDGGAQYVFEGSALFREDNLDILESLGDPEKTAALTDEQK